MASFETLGLLVVAGIASLFTAWTIGAGSSGSTPFAPSVGANAISTMRAGFVVGILGLLGAVFQGANVTETVGGELVHGVTLTPVAATIALGVAATLIAAGVFLGYPIATAFVVSGAVVGAGLAMGGDPAVERYLEIVAFWLLTPLVGTPLAYATARILRSERITEDLMIPTLAAMVGVVIANMSFSLLGGSDEALSLSVTTARTLRPIVPSQVGRIGTTLLLAGVSGGVVHQRVRTDPVRTERQFLLALGALVAFSAGGGKVGLAVGPLLPLIETLDASVPLVAVLAFGGLGLLVGSWMAATRMIKALSQDYSDLGPRRSIAVLVPSFLIAQAGIFLGVPMSFNEIFISAIAGSGLAAGKDTVSRRKLGYTALAWVGSLLLGGLLSYVGVFAVGVVS